MLTLLRTPQMGPNIQMNCEKPSVAIANLRLFEGLTAVQLAWINSRLCTRTFQAGMDFILADTPGEVVYIILSGTCKVYIMQLDGSQVIVNLLGPGDTVGEMSVINSTGRSANVITLEETRVAWLSREHFQEALQTIPILAQNMLRILSGRLRLTTDHFQTIASLDIPGRIAHQLLAIAEIYGEMQPEGIYIPIRLTQGDISELVGASRKRVNQVIVALKRDGVLSIDAQSHILIHDAARLRRWV